MAPPIRVRADPRARVARALLRALLGPFFAIRLEGAEHLPEGGYVLASNHLSWVDPFVILAALPARPRIHFLGRRSAVYNRAWKRWALRAWGGVIAVEPGSRSAALSVEVASVLRAGGSLAIFPEGEMGAEEGSLLRFRPGVARYAAASGLPVVPAGLAGTLELWLRKPIVLKLGPPLRCRDESETELERIRVAVAGIMPLYSPPGGKRRWTWLTHLLR